MGGRGGGGGKGGDVVGGGFEGGWGREDGENEDFVGARGEEWIRDVNGFGMILKVL